MKAIIAVNNLGFIGKGDKLLWHNKKDLNHFKRMTYGDTLLVGYRTAVSTLNYDPIYDDENYIVVSDDVKVDTLNEFQFRNKLRTDIGFRLDFAQYALSQPDHLIGITDS